MKSNTLLLILCALYVLPSQAIFESKLPFEPKIDARSSQLDSLDSLMQVLESGGFVRVVNYYYNCLLDNEPGPQAIGGTTINLYEYFAAGAFGNPQAYISFSDTQFIFQSHYGYVYDYVKTRIFEDSSVEIVAQYLLPTNFTVVMSETFSCWINNSTNPNGGVSLIAIPSSSW